MCDFAANEAAEQLLVGISFLAQTARTIHSRGVRAHDFFWLGPGARDRVLSAPKRVPNC